MAIERPNLKSEADQKEMEGKPAQIMAVGRQEMLDKAIQIVRTWLLNPDAHRKSLGADWDQHLQSLLGLFESKSPLPPTCHVGRVLAGVLDTVAYAGGWPISRPPYSKSKPEWKEFFEGKKYLVNGADEPILFSTLLQTFVSDSRGHETPWAMHGSSQVYLTVTTANTDLPPDHRWGGIHLKCEADKVVLTFG